VRAYVEAGAVRFPDVGREKSRVEAEAKVMLSRLQTARTREALAGAFAGGRRVFARRCRRRTEEGLTHSTFYQ